MLPSRFDQLLTTYASWLLVACAAWVLAIGCAAVAERRSGGRWRCTRWVGCPPTLRRLLLAGLGLSLFSGPVPGGAATANSTPSGSCTARTVADVRTDPHRPALPVPTRPVGALVPRHPTTIRVRPGDSLWQIARARLRDDAPASEVLALVKALVTGNQHTIGSDPDLIHPGQQLVVPALRAAPSVRLHHPRQENP